MSDISLITPHDDVTLMADEVEKVRACVAGQFFVKQLGTKLLPHPSDIDQTSKEAVARYLRYIKAASFVEIPGQTKKSILGKLNADELGLDIPDRVSYLESDANKDGLSLIGLTEQIAGEQLEMKWCVLVSDYQGLTDVDTSSITIADLERLNPRSTINLYTRENVIDWDFARVNGRMQLVYILLRETASEFDYNDSISGAVKTEVESYLKLALDEDGNYYQQKLVYGASKNQVSEGERNYPLINGSALKFLPVEIVSDMEQAVAEMPRELGYLNGICDLTLDRYINDADYKEMLHKMPATLFIGGVDNDFDETFPQLNNGRRYIDMGGVNVLDGADVEVNILSATDHTGAYDSFKDRNEKEIRALGGVFPSDELRQRTAAETIIEAANMTAMLNPMVTALEQGLANAIGYCCMFEGLVSPDDVMTWASDNITVDLPREFASQKMGTEERKQLLMEYNAGTITKSTYLKLLDEGGVIPDWEEELQALELEPPRISV